MISINGWRTRNLEQVTWRENTRIRYDWRFNTLASARNKIRREAAVAGHKLTRFQRIALRGVPLAVAHCSTPDCLYTAAINTETAMYTGPDITKCPLSI